MAFDFSTLVTDRTQQDVAYARQLAEKLVAGTATEEEKAEWNSFTLKGVYNHTDLNRVTAAMEDLKLRLEGYGYAVPDYQNIEIDNSAVPKKLPDGSIELTYIESTGTQYIDTGFKPNQDTKTVIDGMWSTKPTGNSVFYGARTSASEKSYYWMFVGISNAARSGYNASFGYNWKIDPTVRRIVTKDKNVTIVDGATHSWTYAAFQCDYNMTLFALNEVGTAKWFARGRIYSCKIYDNGVLVRDFVPCINPAGKVGLYDLVTSAFFSNSGTGTFIAGDAIMVSSKSVSMTNLIADGSFETTGTWVTWSADALVTEQSLFGSKSLKLTGDQLANVSVETPIVGHKYYGREYIKTDGEVTIGDGRFEVHGGDGVGLNWVYGWNRGNYPNWTMQSAIHEIEVVNASSYVLRTFKVGGTGTCYVDGILLVDLTASFGAGFEPDKEWCDTYIPFFEGTQSVKLPPRYEWKEYDIPTTGQMVMYLQNVSVIRSVLAVMASTPEAPDDMVELMVKEANDIEVILLDVYKQINIMTTTFIPCGEALCGGDNL